MSEKKYIPVVSDLVGCINKDGTRCAFEPLNFAKQCLGIKCMSTDWPDGQDRIFVEVKPTGVTE